MPAVPVAASSLKADHWLATRQQVAALLSVCLVADTDGVLALRTQREDKPENSHNVKLISGPAIDNSQ